MRSLISTLSICAILIGCSSAAPRPKFKVGQGGANVDPSTGLPAGDKGSGGGGDSGAGVPPVISKSALKKVTDEIVGPTSERCAEESATSNPAEIERSILRLLTRDEYQKTISDVFGTNKNFYESLTPEQKAHGFANNASINLVGETALTAFVTTAREVAKTVLNENSSLPCKEGNDCAEKILNSVAPLAWRRPLEGEEKARLLRLYQTASADGVKIGLEVMLTGLLTSPHFLYRSEVGKSGKLTSHEAASALSYFFWASPPDAELRKLADDGTLLDNKILLAQAQRLLKSDRASSGVSGFSDAYLSYSNVSGASKNPEKLREFTTDVRQGLLSEARNTFDYWVRAKNSKFADIFTAQQTVGNEALAEFYDAPLTQVEGLKTLDFSGSKRQGILGFGGILALLATSDESHPIRRGIYIREHLLCETMAPTPPGLVIAIPSPKPGMTTRQRFAVHTSDKSCASCHDLIDGVGFGMEDFDGVGRYRDRDENLPVDASGNFVGLDGKDQKFTGVQGMSEVLKDSDRAKRCFVLQAFRQAAGRFETKGDVCGIRHIADDFIQKDKSLSEVLLNVITSPTYLERGH